jgi:hypothetical protein
MTDSDDYSGLYAPTRPSGDLSSRIQAGNEYAARSLGFRSMEHLLSVHDCSSPDELARKHGFKNFADFCSAPGFVGRLQRIRNSRE